MGPVIVIVVLVGLAWVLARAARAPPPALARRRCRTRSSSATRSSPPAACTRVVREADDERAADRDRARGRRHARPPCGRCRRAWTRSSPEAARGRAAPRAPRTTREAELTCPRLASRRSHLTLIVLLIAALAGVGAARLCPARRSTARSRKGLDLQGGLEVVLQAQAGRRARQSPPAEMTNSISIMRTPRRQARRLRAGDHPAGLEPDRTSSCRRCTTRRRRRRSSARPPQLELYDLTPSLLGAVDRRARRTPVPTRASSTC